MKVKAGDQLTIGIGKGGAGGSAGSGKYNNGKPGAEGQDSTVADLKKWRALVNARHGRPGQGGGVSGTWRVAPQVPVVPAPPG
ncbi:hypothetical protein ACFWAG_39750 [Streptomyces violascens]|uniref:hypothetical protein n=1 Tax=Streptomyces violascens TaxID=67381 RepID=UPI003663BF5B